MWLTIKDLYTDDVKAQDLYSGSLSRQFKVSQGQVRGEYLPPLCPYPHMLLLQLEAEI